MTDAAITAVLSASGLLVMALLGALVARGQVRWVWIAAALGSVLVHDIALTRGLGLIARVALLDAEWNVTGKLYAIAAVLILAALLRMPRRELGLSLGTGGKAWSGWIVCLILVSMLAIAVVVAPGEGTTWDAVTYQATLPGLEEELFYRGLLLALVARAFAPSGGVRAVLIPAVITTALFVQAHVLVAVDGAVRVHPTGAPTALIVGSVLIWLRLRTGGLAAPVLLHNAVNTALRLL